MHKHGGLVVVLYMGLLDAYRLESRGDGEREARRKCICINELVCEAHSERLKAVWYVHAKEKHFLNNTQHNMNAIFSV